MSRDQRALSSSGPHADALPRTLLGIAGRPALTAEPGSQPRCSSTSGVLAAKSYDLLTVLTLLDFTSDISGLSLHLETFCPVTSSLLCQASPASSDVLF